MSAGQRGCQQSIRHTVVIHRTPGDAEDDLIQPPVEIFTKLHSGPYVGMRLCEVHLIDQNYLFRLVRYPGIPFSLKQAAARSLMFLELEVLAK